MKKLKKIPTFRNEAEERLFWETRDTTDYVDWSTAKRVRFPNLKPSVMPENEAAGVDRKKSSPTD